MFVERYEIPLTKNQVAKLKADPRVADVENEGMDEGRFFVHLKTSYFWPAPYSDQRTKSFGSYKEAAAMLKRVAQ